MDTIKLTSLTTGETIATIDTVCLVELQKAMSGSSDRYHVMVLNEERLEKLADATCAEQTLSGLTKALGDSESLPLGYHSVNKDSRWTITGQIRDCDDSPLAGLCVLAYDKDAAKKDDFLGCAFTDTEGAFEITYDESDFKRENALIDFEGNPDIYLEISSYDKSLSKRTATKSEAEDEEHFEIKLDTENETELLRPVVGYYYIEENQLENEIAHLEELIKDAPEVADNHFLLGLCFIEMMKADLRKSEWMIPESRLKDDVLASAAIEEFEQVVALDPDREEEAREYQSYVKELQNLAL